LDIKHVIIGLFLVFIFLFGCLGPSSVENAAAKSTASGIELSWSASQSADVTGYNIYRSEAQNVLGNKINPVLITSLNYVDSNVQNGKTYYYTIRAFANSAEDSNKNQVSATAITLPPSDLSIQINNGAAYTKEKDISLALYAKGAKNCRYSNDGTNWSPWSTYITQKLWTLTDGEGEKIVYYQCQNEAELISDPVSTKITYKTSGPSISILSPLQNDVLGTKFEMDFKVSGAVGDITCVIYADNSQIPVLSKKVQNDVLIQIPAVLSDGTHSGYMECTDEIGTTKTDTIYFEIEENPISFKINGGASHTGSTQVTLDIYGPSANQCRFSNDGVSWSAWSLFSPTKTWTLFTGDGKKTIFMECKTSAGVSLGVVSDNIIYQNIPTPDVKVSINNGASKTYTTSVQLTIYSTYATACRYSEDRVSWTDWNKYTTQRWFSLKSVNGIHTVYVQCENQYGDIGEGSASIFLQKDPDDVPTELSILINGGSSSTSSSSVTLTLNARHATDCRYMNDGESWSSWSSFTRKTYWSLSPGSGTKTVYYQCRNDIGTSRTTQSSIQVASQKPVVSISSPTDGEMVSDETILLKFKATSSENYLSCTYTCNGKELSAGNVPTGQEITKTLIVEGAPMPDYCGLPAAGSRFSTSVTCTDGSGNSGSSSLVTFIWTKWVGPLT